MNEDEVSIGQKVALFNCMFMEHGEGTITDIDAYSFVVSFSNEWNDGETTNIIFVYGLLDDTSGNYELVP